MVRRANLNLPLYSVREWLQMLRDTAFGVVETLDGLPGNRVPPCRVCALGAGGTETVGAGIGRQLA